MATKGIYIKHVGQPTDKRNDGTRITGSDGESRRFWRLTLVKRSGVGGARKLEAGRNFWYDDHDTLDYEIMRELAEADPPVDLSRDEEPFRVEKVDIHPREVWRGGEPLVDEETGEILTHNIVRLLVLPGETVKGALAASYSNPPAYLADEPLPGSKSENLDEATRQGEVLRALAGSRANGQL